MQRKHDFIVSAAWRHESFPGYFLEYLQEIVALPFRANCAELDSIVLKLDQKTSIVYSFWSCAFFFNASVIPVIS